TRLVSDWSSDVCLPICMLGQVATLGRHKGIADVFGFPFRGFLGWWITRTYHLYQLPLISRKFRVLVDWTVGLFFPRDIAELGRRSEERRVGKGGSCRCA